MLIPLYVKTDFNIVIPILAMIFACGYSWNIIVSAERKSDTERLFLRHGVCSPIFLLLITTVLIGVFYGFLFSLSSVPENLKIVQNISDLTIGIITFMPTYLYIVGVNGLKQKSFYLFLFLYVSVTTFSQILLSPNYIRDYILTVANGSHNPFKVFSNLVFNLLNIIGDMFSFIISFLIS
jgi:hypothetical protein